MAIQIIEGGEYADMLKQAESVPDPKIVRWELDHFAVLTGEDIPPQVASTPEI